MTEDEAVTMAVLLGGEFTEHNPQPSRGQIPRAGWHKHCVRWTCRLKGDTRQSMKRYGTREKAAKAFIQFMNNTMDVADG